MLKYKKVRYGKVVHYGGLRSFKVTDISAS